MTTLNCLDERGWSPTEKLSRNDVEGFAAAYPGRCRCRGAREDHLQRMGHSLSRFVEFLIEYAEGRARASRRSMQAALRTFLVRPIDLVTE